ncbi:MAG: FAD-dependent oxidoreductase [Baekduia sp.]
MGSRTRRQFIGEATAAGVGLAVGTMAPTGAWAATQKRGRSVGVFGGGMAGLTVAHELAERGFKVTVYEPAYLGGKARSMGVPGSGKGGRKDLPGEHGFRFFPGFYHHVPDSMRRIPFDGQANGVWDNLSSATGGKFYRAGNRPDALAFGLFFDPEELATPEGIHRVLMEASSGRGVSFDDMAYFVSRVLVYLTSCEQRRFGQWENTSWWDMIGAGGRSHEYQTQLGEGLTRNLVAAKGTLASTRTIGNMGEAFVFSAMGLGADGTPDRVLDLPTNEAWIDPWVALLRSLGVTFVMNTGLAGLETAGGQISAARTVANNGKRGAVQHDYYVMAMPVERATPLIGRGVRTLDPSLTNMDKLVTDWMVGIQYYLKRRVDLTHGHLSFVDSPWALTGLTQAQFWTDRDFGRDYGDGSALDCLSIDISEWDKPGILYGKTAKNCTANEIAKEVWAQVMACHTPASKLKDSDVVRWWLDPGVHWNTAKGQNDNDTPLLVNTKGSWYNRPKPATKIPNLFMSGDHVQTNIDLATMEGANESGRAAAAGVLQAAGSNATPPKMYKLYQPPELQGWKDFDAWRYSMGMPNLFDG